MAPRGRPPKKPGLTRADAARDAMKAYGFELRLINQTLKELLKVYGEEGWVLIEEASYKVLLDAILEKIEEQEKSEKQEKEKEEHNEAGKDMVDSSSSRAVDAEPKRNPNQETTMGTQAFAYQADDASSCFKEEVNSAVHFPEEPQEQPHHYEGGGVLASDIEEMKQITVKKEYENLHHSDIEECYREWVLRSRSSENHNGWISTDDDEDDNNDDDDDYDGHIMLTPEPLSEDLAKILMEGDGKRKRKRESRWDVRP